jgi:hypothetical protein
MLRVIALIAVLLAACSGSSVALEDLAQELRRARCERLARCQVFPDEGACLAYFRAVGDASVAAGVATEKIAYDGERAKQCVDATAAQSCDLTTSEARAGIAACADMLVGKVADGGACALDVECTSGTCELPSDCLEFGCCVGTCRASRSGGAAGDPCVKQRECKAGLVCGQNETCVAPASAGGACHVDRECAAGLACVGLVAPSPGTCAALPHLGEPCPEQRCADENLRCDVGGTNTCVALGVPGAACPDGDECAIYFTCDAEAKTCRDYPSLGMPCEFNCAQDSYCPLSGPAAGTCTAPRKDGELCEGDQECESMYCEEGPVLRTCVTRVCF